MPRRLKLKRAEIALFAIPLLVLLFAFAATRLRSHFERRTLSKPTRFSIDIIAFSPDGKTFATGDAAGAIEWWDARSGKRRRTLQKRGGLCLCAGWSRDGRVFVATSGNTLLIHNGRTGALLYTRIGPLTNLGTLAISPDGRLVAVGASSGLHYFGTGRICLWDTTLGRQVGALGGSVSLVAGLDFSLDGQSLVAYNGAARGASAASAEVVQMWDVRGRRMLWEQAAHSFGAIRFSPDGSRFVIGSDKPAVRDRQTGSLLSEMRVQGGGTWRMSYQAGGQVLAGSSNTYRQSLAFWDAATGELVWQGSFDTDSFGGTADAFAFSPDEKRLVYVDSNNDVQMWDTSRLNLKKVIDQPEILDRPKRLWVLDTLRTTVR
jgi:WD40 repeat protein